MSKFATYPTPKHPFREALAIVVGKDPPAYVKGYGTQGLKDSQITDLQDWCSMNARPEWATGLSMIEAAELIVAGAVENANILNRKDAAANAREERLARPKKKLKPLTPPDLERCQADVPNGHSFMTLGGSPGRVRCNNVPTVVVKENQPGKDGRKGTMSLCEQCSKMLLKEMGPEYATFRPIKRIKADKARREASSRGSRIDGSTRIGE